MLECNFTQHNTHTYACVLMCVRASLRLFFVNVISVQLNHYGFRSVPFCPVPFHSSDFRFRSKWQRQQEEASERETAATQLQLQLLPLPLPTTPTL